MRADRLLSILLLLQAHRQLTSRELAWRLEVAERTIHRDMEALSAAGIPVVAERGARGGWSLLGEYRTNLTGLNEAAVKGFEREWCAFGSWRFPKRSVRRLQRILRERMQDIGQH